MNTIATIREFKTPHFTIRVRAVEDNGLDLSFDETGEIAQKLDDGHLMAFGVVATAYYNGAELAEDSLWGCIYEHPADFEDHRQCGAETQRLRATGSNAVVGSYFADMVRNVCAEAREAIRKMQSVRVRAEGVTA